MKFSTTASTLALCAAVVQASTPTNGGPVDSRKMQAHVCERGLLKNLKDLDRIASENGGNRAFGLPGYAASVKYIQKRVGRSKYFKSYVQDFPALFAKVESIDFTVTGKSYHIYGLTYSPSTSPEGMDAQLILGPAGNKACTASEYAKFNVKDKMVLVERGQCPDGTTLAGRVRAAVSAGASAVIIYHNLETHTTAGSLSKPDPDAFRPAGFINRVDGLALIERLNAGEEIIAHFQQTQTIQTKITQNVFVESIDGDPHNIVMLGAHLDSVQAGAGINDDGSGTCLLLELFDALQRGYKPVNKIKLAWWGAEENGLVGSRYFTSNVTPKEADDILCYLNFDMVSKGYFGVFDGDGSSHGLAGAPGSDYIEKLFVDHISKKVTVTPAVFTGGSDYASFMSTLNKPVGGLHTGTGVEQDPCYHQKCDTFANANGTVLEINAKAAAHVLAVISTEGHKFIPKTPFNATLAARDLDGFDAFPWTHVEGEKHLGTCGADI